MCRRNRLILSVLLQLQIGYLRLLHRILIRRHDSLRLISVLHCVRWLVRGDFYLLFAFSVEFEVVTPVLLASARHERFLANVDLVDVQLLHRVTVVDVFLQLQILSIVLSVFNSTL